METAVVECVCDEIGEMEWAEMLFVGIVGDHIRLQGQTKCFAVNGVETDIIMFQFRNAKSVLLQIVRLGIKILNMHLKIALIEFDTICL